MKLISRYFCDAVKHFSKSFIFPLIIMLVMSVLSAVTPYLFRIFAANLSDDIAYFFTGIILFATYLLLQTFIKMYWNYLLDGFGGKYIRYLSTNIGHALAGAYRSDTDREKPENLQHILYYDVLDIFRVIALMIPMAIKSFIITIVAVVLGFFYGTIITVYILIAFILGVLLSFASRKMISTASRKTNIKMKSMNATAAEFIENLSITQTNSLQKYYDNKISASIDEFIDTAKSEDIKTYFWHGIIENYNALFTIILSALLAMPFAGGSIVNLVFFTMLADIIMSQGQSAQNYLLRIMKSRVCFENVNKLLSLPQRKGTKDIEDIHSIKFSHVDFSYPYGEKVLKDFNCELYRGQAVKISGANGSGKSTIAKLISGMYVAEKGTILFNDTSSDAFLQEQLNDKILYISQEENLLNERVIDYLSILSKRNVSEDEFRELCELTTFNEGNVLIADGGQNLSSGQRKKIMIMRYMLEKDYASIIILDEIFAGLDNKCKHIFTEILNNDIQKKNKIFILIEHEDLNLKTTKTIMLEQ